MSVQEMTEMLVTTEERERIEKRRRKEAERAALNEWLGMVGTRIRDAGGMLDDIVPTSDGRSDGSIRVHFNVDVCPAVLVARAAANHE